GASFFFFFQAEDGIRDFHVTGVQTCALPISIEVPAVDLVVVKPTFGVSAAEAYSLLAGFTPRLRAADIVTALAAGEEPGWRNARSEERRVGKECRARWSRE